MLGEIAMLGPIDQIAYVDADIDAAVQFWTSTVGAGPFLLFEHPHMDEAWYRGRRIRLDISIALGYWRDMQIEIIQQHDETPSIYHDQQHARDKGINHLGIFVEDLSPARATCARTNCEIVQEMYVGDKGGIYVDTGGGRLIEFAALPKAFVDALPVIKAAARGWDGCEPLRTL
jgi:methylmalonyl-CoA/ethylmalonyl-CoA epimerase